MRKIVSLYACLILLLLCLTGCLHLFMPITKSSIGHRLMELCLYLNKKSKNGLFRRKYLLFFKRSVKIKSKEMSRCQNNYSKERLNINTARKVLVYVLGEALKLLHPFMPFITEEIYASLPGVDGTIML